MDSASTRAGAKSAPDLENSEFPIDDLPEVDEHDVRNNATGAPRLRAVDVAPKKQLHRRIGEILVDLGFASHDDVFSAVNEASATGKQTGRVLYDRGLISKDQLVQAIAERTHLSYLDMRTLRVDERALRTVNAATAARYRAIPVQFIDDDTLLIAISEPSNVPAADNIALMTGLNVRAALTTTEQLEELLAQVSRSDVAQATQVADSQEQAASQNQDSSPEDDRTSAQLLESILTSALRQRASDVHLDPAEDGSIRVRFRIDGMTHDVTHVQESLATRFFARLKVLCGMDITLRHIPQDGRATFGDIGSEVTLRVATLPTINGESAAIRVLDRQNVPPLERLGMDEYSLSALTRALKRPHGAILATGPTGSGKTTTLYAALAQLNTPERTILTIEDPVEYPLAGVKQVQINQKRGLSFAVGLRTMLRSDPDVVMVGEIRDQETAKIGVEAALTGRLVLSTLHTNNAASAVTRLTEMGVERYLVASAVECVVASRLARRLCTECRQPARINRATMAEAGFHNPGVDHLDVFEADGCPTCSGTGYRGRVGLFEVLAIDDEIRQMLIDRMPAKAIEQVAQRNGMISLKEAALARVQEGMISLSEATRVTSFE